jgi:hypothetical protein
MCGRAARRGPVEKRRWNRGRYSSARSAFSMTGGSTIGGSGTGQGFFTPS